MHKRWQQSFTAFANDQGFFPTKNFQVGTFKKHENLGEESQKKHLRLKEYGCFTCPIHCTKVGMIRRGKRHQGRPRIRDHSNSRSIRSYTRAQEE
ncbi:MAG: aldehyde ferredoxin oxidoreductase C-terminal domain-containing protein [Candidatus Heimdallarchaeota archaeon]